MSTRRSTRATSRQASSRGASPAISNVDIPNTPASATRRASRRSGNTPLPAVGLRASTAYGTNTVAQPGRVAGPQISDQISNVLSGLLEPVPEIDHENGSNAAVPSARGASSAARSGRRSLKGSQAPSDANRSFNNESQIFGVAGIESSSIADPSDVGMPDIRAIPDEYSSDDSAPFPPSLDAQNEALEREALEILARRRLEEARAAHERTWQPVKNIFSSLKSVVGNVFSTLASFDAKRWIFTAGAMIVLSLFIASYQNEFGLDDLQHQIGKFLPSRPLDFFKPDEVREIYKRLDELEYQVGNIKRAPDFSKSIVRIEELLPDFLFVKMDKSGEVRIPKDLWHALRDRIRADQTLTSDPVDNVGKGSSSKGLSVKDVRRVTGEESGKLWNEWLGANKVRLEKLSSDELTSKFPQLLKDNHVISKVDIVELIRKNWYDNEHEVKSEIRQLARNLQEVTDRIAKLPHSTAGITKHEARTIAQEVISNFIPDLQLDALARANLKNNAIHGIKQINHFSKGTGAVIDPHLTSPNYVFPSQDVWFPTRWGHWAIGNPIPPPNPPEAALTNWEEHGDCWCSPATDNQGFGPSLGVLTGNEIYPEQVIIENIDPSAALEPGAAPRDMELLAYITDIDIYNTVRSYSEEIFNDEAGELQHPYRFVKIASWTYDLESHQNVQAFPVQLDLKSLGAKTNKLVVRAKNNWGGGNVDYTCLYRVRLNGEISQL